MPQHSEAPIAANIITSNDKIHSVVRARWKGWGCGFKTPLGSELIKKREKKKKIIPLFFANGC
jgi:hypothetical protein